jgi:hypothetical protein
MMTEPDPTPDPAPDPAAAPDETLGAAGTKALDAERKARKAAERRLQDADSRVQALQRAEIERVAGQAADGYKPLTDPSDLWRADGVDVTSLLADDGSIDPAKVREAVGRVIATKPHWATQAPRVAGGADARVGSGGGEASMDDLAAKIVRGR